MTANNDAESLDLDGKERVECADDVVVLCVDGVVPIDHGVRSRALLPEVHQCIGRESLEGLGEELEVQKVANLQFDVIPRNLAPSTSHSVRSPFCCAWTTGGCDRGWGRSV